MHPLVLPRASPLKCYYSACPKMGVLRCSRCKAWYCSQRCQVEDWQYHKNDCEEPPPLEHPDG